MVGEDLCFWPVTNFGQKIGLNLSEDLFFFWFSPNFGQKIGLILGEIIFILIFVLLKFSEVPGIGVARGGGQGARGFPN